MVAAVATRALEGARQALAELGAVDQARQRVMAGAPADLVELAALLRHVAEHQHRAQQPAGLAAYGRHGIIHRAAHAIAATQHGARRAL